MISNNAKKKKTEGSLFVSSKIWIAGSILGVTKKEPLDQFLHKFFPGNGKYDCLTLSHGQASVERGFSVNKVNQEELFLLSQRLVCDHLRGFNITGRIFNITGRIFNITGRIFNLERDRKTLFACQRSIRRCPKSKESLINWERAIVETQVEARKNSQC